MTDILEDSTDVRLRSFLSKKQVLDLSHWPLFSIVDKMIPRISVTIKHCRCFDLLYTVCLASLAFECIVGIASRFWLVLEKLSQGIQGKMSFDIFR